MGQHQVDHLTLFSRNMELVVAESSITPSSWFSIATRSNPNTSCDIQRKRTCCQSVAFLSRGESDWHVNRACLLWVLWRHWQVCTFTVSSWRTDRGCHARAHTRTHWEDNRYSSYSSPPKRHLMFGQGHNIISCPSVWYFLTSPSVLIELVFIKKTESVLIKP